MNILGLTRFCPATVLTTTALFTTLSLAVSCGSSDDSTPGAGSGGESGSTGEGGAGVGADAGAGGDDGLTPECAALKGQMLDWLGAHRACSADEACARVDPPLVPTNAQDVCNTAAAFDARARADLEALTAEWARFECVEKVDGSVILECPYVLGEAECKAGACTLVRSPDPVCPDTIDPVCTVSGQNALNECYANEFLHDPPASLGLCPDTPACTDQGGTCHSVFDNGPPCPDGSTFAPSAPDFACAGGNFPTSCCVPSGVDCTLVVRSMSLDTDPFTCEGFDMAPFSLCLGANTSACRYDTRPSHGIGEIWNADIAVQTFPGNKISVTGIHHDLHRTFECSGSISHDLEPSETWQCRACDEDQTNCTSCEIQQRTYCDP